MAIETQKEKLKQHQGSRDFFCLVSDAFRIFARRASIVLGSALAFASAILVIVIWGLTGPTFHFSNTWQLIINTGTTIVTFLMVFLIQNTQNRDAKAAHLKLDELIRALKGARNELIDLEKLADEDLTSLEKQFERVRKKAERNKNNAGGMSRANRAECATTTSGDF
jgi:low affinity Fe/Cu permease